MYLIDSDYIINFLNGKEKAVEVFDKLKREDLFTSIICVGEILEGIYMLQDGRKMRQFERLLQHFEVLDVNEEVIEEFAKIRVALRKSGCVLDNFDMIIAATCVAHNLKLVTGNIKHFQRINKLEIFT